MLVILPQDPDLRVQALLAFSFHGNIDSLDDRYVDLVKKNGLFQENERDQFLELYDSMYAHNATVGFFKQFVNCFSSIKQGAAGIQIGIQNLMRTIHAMLDQDSFDSTSERLGLLNTLIKGYQGEGTVRLSSVKGILSLMGNGKLTVTLDSLDLTFPKFRSSTSIERTIGYILLPDFTFHGYGGRIRCNLPEVSLTATGFKLNLATQALHVDSALLFDKKYPFTRNIIAGEFEDQATGNFPRFTAHQAQTVRMDSGAVEIFGRYRRAPSGHSFVALDSNASPYSPNDFQEWAHGVADFYRDAVEVRFKGPGDSLILTSTCKTVLLKANRIHGTKGAVNIWVADSNQVHHPEIFFNYYLDKGELVIQVHPGRKSLPYVSPYHGVSLYGKHMMWKRGDKVVKLGAGHDQPNTPAFIESLSLFDAKWFRKLRRHLRYNPMMPVYVYSAKKRGIIPAISDIIQVNSYITDPALFNAGLKNCHEKGILNCFAGSDSVTLTKRGVYFATAARGIRSYDSLIVKMFGPRRQYISISPGLSKLSLNEVIDFKLGDRVHVAPDERGLILGKRRELGFFGKIHAGENGITSVDHAFHYDYDSNLVRLTHVKVNFLLNLPPGSSKYTRNQKALRKLVIEGASGTLFLGKSSDNDRFKLDKVEPHLVIGNHAHVYYDDKDIQNGIYTRDRFYFKLNPFSIHNLKDYKEEELDISGSLFTGGITDSIEGVLKPLPGNESYGMIHKTKQSGISVYHDSGNFNGTLKMDQTGFRGIGRLSLGNVVFESEDYLLTFDRMRSELAAFSLQGGEEGGVLFPNVKGTQVTMDWDIQRQEIVVNTVGNSKISLFDSSDSTRQFDGRLTIRPQSGMEGSGKLTLGNIAIQSSDLKFGQNTIQTDNGNFQVSVPDTPGDVVFSGKGASLEYHAQNNTVAFASDNPYLFPTHNMEARFPNGTYEQADNKLVLSGQGGTSTFLDGDLTGLSIPSTVLLLDNDKSAIKLKGVQKIPLVDATLFPRDSEVRIQEPGKMDTLRQAQLKFGRFTLENAEVAILSATSYAGSGTFSYDAGTGIKQLVTITNVSVQNGVSSGSGLISLSDAFELGNKVRFKGKLGIKGGDNHPRATGFVSLRSSVPGISSEWIKFDGIANPRALVIPITKGEKGNLKYCGLFFDERAGHTYTLFLQEDKRNVKGQPVCIADGFLTLDSITQDFKAVSNGVLNNTRPWKNRVRLDEADGDLVLNGHLALPLVSPKVPISVSMAGNWNQPLGGKQVIASLDIALQSELLNKAFWEYLVSGQQASLPDHDYVLRWPNFASEVRQSETYTELVTEAGRSQMPKHLKDLIILNDVPFSYHSPHNAYYGNKSILVSGIGGKKEGFEIKVSVEWIPARNGKPNRFNLLLFNDAGQDQELLIQVEGDHLTLYTPGMTIGANLEKKLKDSKINLITNIETGKDRVNDFIDRFSEWYLFND